eukprot:gene9713-16767_t
MQRRFLEQTVSPFGSKLSATVVTSKFEAETRAVVNRNLFREYADDTLLDGVKIDGTTERWEQLCDDAVKILKDPALELVPARIACEVQIVFESHKQARHDIHDAYDVSRANKDVQLYNQFASSALTDDQRADATDFLTACLRGQNSVVKKFIAAEKRKSTSGDQKLAAKSMINTECQKGTSEGLEKGKTATYYAVKNNHPDILKLLLDNGADLTPEDQELAFKDGYVEITTMFNLSAEDATKQLPQA